jgi:hypothetical protein
MATWAADKLLSYDSYESKENIVYAIEYSISHTEGSKACKISGLINLDLSDLSSLTAYASITEENAITWVKATLGEDEVAALEAVITARAEEQNRTGVTTGKTW